MLVTGAVLPPCFSHLFESVQGCPGRPEHVQLEELEGV